MLDHLRAVYERPFPVNEGRKGGGGGGVVHGSRELKSKIHGSRELKQTFHELLNFLLNEFFTHIVLQN